MPDYTPDDDRALAQWLGLPASKEESSSHFKSRTRYLTAPTPESDYRVLEAVRKRPLVQSNHFSEELVRILSERRCATARPFSTSDHLHYEPGDFARAAHTIMQEQTR